MLVKAIASRAAVTSSSTSGAWSLSRVNSANRIRWPGARRGWLA